MSKGSTKGTERLDTTVPVQGSEQEKWENGRNQPSRGPHPCSWRDGSEWVPTLRAPKAEVEGQKEQ